MVDGQMLAFAGALCHQWRMRIIFSRKGFDSGSGGAPSPIIDDRPVSLPIPTKRRSATSYADLGLGDIVERVTRGKIGANHLAHEDPMFFAGRCLFGQCGAAQSHLLRQGVGTGDMFLFFGLFADRETGERHHRIFGWMRVEATITGDDLRGSNPMLAVAPRQHPHCIGKWNANNCIWTGPGGLAASADPQLRLTVPGGPLRLWQIPSWLGETGLSYHGRADRWRENSRLETVSRGQEFVVDAGERPDVRLWLESILEAMNA